MWVILKRKRTSYIGKIMQMDMLTWAYAGPICDARPNGQISVQLLAHMGLNHCLHIVIFVCLQGCVRRATRFKDSRALSVAPA